MDIAQRFNEGNAAYRAGRWHDALLAYQGAVASDAAFVPAWLQAARCHVQLGQWMPAREAFAQTLQREPDNYSAWLEAGHLCRQMGEVRQGVMAYRRAMAVAPHRYEAALGLARCLELVGSLAEGESAYRQAVRLAEAATPPQALQVHRLMARYRVEQGDSERAVPALAAALEAAARGEAGADARADLQVDLGEALLRLGRRDEAMRVLGAASAATSETVLARLAATSFRFNLWQEALEVSRRNVALHPSSATAHWNLAHLLSECWRMDEAEQVLAQAEALAPMPGASTMRAAIAGRRGDADTALAIYADQAGRPDAPSGAASSAAMSALYSDRMGPAEVAALHRSLFAALGEGARDATSFRRDPLAGRRLRLGLVSADFHHQHPVNLFMQPVLRELDRSRFEVHLYYTGVTCDEQTLLARSRVARWHEVSSFNDRQLARRIDDDGIDLLIDLAGHTGQHRMRLFAQRAAPVQASYLGYPGSTGVPNIDWLIGDPVVTPPEHDALCSERVARLPHTVFCYAPEADYPTPAYGPEHATRPVTFGSFNNIPKLTLRTLQVWARVLNAVPGSRLLLKAPSFGDAGAVAMFRHRFASLDVDPARIEFRGPTGLADMMAEYADIDIALDPMPYNGGTTTLQALWMGVPVVTREGGHFVSRMGASFLRAAGLADWVAADDEAYVAIARDRASDRDALLQLKRGLRSALLARPAWDVRAQTRALEALWWAMAEGRGEVPRGLGRP